MEASKKYEGATYFCDFCGRPFDEKDLHSNRNDPDDAGEYCSTKCANYQSWSR